MPYGKSLQLKFTQPQAELIREELAKSWDKKINGRGRRVQANRLFKILEKITHVLHREKYHSGDFDFMVEEMIPSKPQLQQ